MALSAAQRARVVDSAVEMLKDRQVERLVQIVEERLAAADYPQGSDEEELDRITLAIVQTIREQLER